MAWQYFHAAILHASMSILIHVVLNYFRVQQLEGVISSTALPSKLPVVWVLIITWSPLFRLIAFWIFLLEQEQIQTGENAHSKCSLEQMQTQNIWQSEFR
jgi:hypothetical protein